MRSVNLTVRIFFSDDGVIDAPAIMSGVDHALNKAKAEGAITPEEEEHATLKSIVVDL